MGSHRAALRSLALRLLALTVASLAAVPAAVAAPATPEAFSSCGELVRHAQRQALRIERAGGTPGSGYVTAPSKSDKQARLPAMPPPMAVTVPPSGESAFTGGFSSTNVQEEGVDEPDIVKTDGVKVFAVAEDALRALTISHGTPRLVGSLKLRGGSHQLLLSGDRLIVLAKDLIQNRDGGYLPWQLRIGTLLTEIDVSNPASMRILRTMQIPGYVVGARLRDGVARLVVSSMPKPIEMRRSSRGDESRRGWKSRRRQGISRTTLGTWRPSYVLEHARGSKIRRPLVNCGSVRRPRTFSGLGLLTVLTIDMSKSLRPVDSDALMTEGETIYAGADSLYVATERWFDPGRPPRRLRTGSHTTIHKFDTSRRERTVMRASGTVRGFVLNQWSLSEHEGRLRVATTDSPEWFESRRRSESFVTILDDHDGTLRTLGRVGKLGRDERIYAVRFIGDIGFVVTFRETDPLYTLDLSDPHRPKVLGELKIPGYSAYLHPIGDGLLIGVGQHATKRGELRGAQVSLFDVSDLRRPVRLARRTLSRPSESEVERDHHAFLWWAPESLSVIPVVSYPQRKGQRGFYGALGFHASRERGLVERRRVVNPGNRYTKQIRRSLVVGRQLLTLSDSGLMFSRLDTLSRTRWVPFKRAKRED